MKSEFIDALAVLKQLTGQPRLSTGLWELDDLLGGGLELGTFTIFHNARVGIHPHQSSSSLVHDSALYGLLANCQRPKERNGFGLRPILVNCGDYNKSQALLDHKRITSLLKESGLDASTAIDGISVVSAYNPDQAERAADEIGRSLASEQRIGLVVVRGLSSLFLESRDSFTGGLEKMAAFQHVLASFWKTCSTARVALVASTEQQVPSRRPVRNSKLPSGTLLKHMAQTIVVFETDRSDGGQILRLVKHPHRLPATVKIRMAS